MKAFHPRVSPLCLTLACVVTAGAEQIQFELPKNDPRYSEYTVPAEERASTVDIRRITLEGELLKAPVVVTADSRDALDPMFKPLSAYLALARKGELAAVLPLYDEPSQKIIRGMPGEDAKRVLQDAAQTDRYEFQLLIRHGPHVVAYGYQRKGDVRMITRVRLIAVGEAYKLEAGAPAFSMKYDLVLNAVLANQGFEGVKRLPAAAK